MNRLLAIGSALLCSATLLLGAASARTSFPERPPGGRLVQDFAGVVSRDAVRQMESINQDLKNKAGVVIAVVTVPELIDETIEELGLRIAETWGVGRAGQDRGIVVVLSLSPRKVTVQTGYGVEGYLPDGRVGQLLDQYAIPYFRSGDFTTGLLVLDQALVARSAAEFGVEVTGASVQPAVAKRPRPLTPGRLILGILALIGLVYMAIRHPRTLFWLVLMFASGGRHRRGGGGFGGGGFGGFGGGGFGGGGASRGF